MTGSLPAVGEPAGGAEHGRLDGRTRSRRAKKPASAAALRAPALLLGAVVLLLILGCRPETATRAPDATELPLAQRDPAENGAEPGRWAQWRGPNSSGIASAGIPPAQVDPERGAVWKTDLPGWGNSSPVVWDNRIFLTAQLDQTDPPTLVVLAVDFHDGRVLWQAEAGAAAGPTHEKNGYASASVATDGRHVVAFFGSAGLFCFDADGNRLWRADLGNLDHQWGTAASPILFDGAVIQLCDSENASYLGAFELADGRPRWRTPRASTGCWTTPVMVQASSPGGQRTEMIVNGAAADDESLRVVVAYDPTDGAELWRVRGTERLVTPVVLVSGGLVYSLSGRNGPILAIQPGGSGDVTDSRLVWRLPRGGPYIPSAIAYRNRLFVLGDAGHLVCYNAGDGEMIWAQRLRGPFTASLIAAGGRIYALSERGVLTVFAAADEYRQLGQSDFGERCLATPAIAQGDLIVRTRTRLYRFAGGRGDEAAAAGARRGPSAEAAPSSGIESPSASKPPSAAESPAAAEPPPTITPTADSWPLARGDARGTGVAVSTLPERLELLWTFTTDRGGFEAVAAIAGGTVYAGSSDGKLYAVDLDSGTRRWEFPTDLGFTASPAVRAGKVYIGDVDGRFYCLDAAAGRKLWDFQTDAEIDSSANFHGGRVLFGSQDSCLYCLDADSGALIWKYQSGDQIRCFPSIAEGSTFVAGCDGKLHVIDLRSGEETATVELGAPTGSTPAVVGRTAFVGTEGNVFCAIDLLGAKVLWQFESPERPAPFRSSAAVSDELVIVGAQDKMVHALRRADGRRVWVFPTRGRVDGSPVVVGRRVFVGSADGRLYALDLESGRELWSFEAGGQIISSPAVASGRLVIGTARGELYCFGAKP